MSKPVLIKATIAVVVCLFSAYRGHTQTCQLLCNQDFSTPYVNGMTLSTNVPCWHTTATDNNIEIWSNGFGGVYSYSGGQFVELNATQASTLYQDFNVTAGQLLTISFAHRARVGVDVMQVEIGPVGGPYTSLGYYTDNTSAWGYYTVNYVVPTTDTYSLRFTAISVGSGNLTVGNFLDAISVTTPPVNISTGSGNDTICAGSNITLTAIGGSTYSWSSNPVGFSSTSSTVTVSPTVTTVYSVAASATCAGSDTGLITVTVIPCTILSISGPGMTICYGDTAAINLITNNAAGTVTYNWVPVTGLSSTNIANPLAFPGTNTTYTVTATDGMNGNTATCTISVIVNPAINTSTGSNPVSCAGLSDGEGYVMVSGGSPAYSYQWNTTPVQTGSNATNIPAGNYTVIITDANGCNDTAMVMVTEPPLLIVNTAADQDTVCRGSSVLLGTTVGGGTPGFSYSWNTGSNQANYNALIDTAGMYSVTVTDMNGCTALSSVYIATWEINLNITPASDSVCTGQQVHLSASASGGTSPYTYVWNGAPGTNQFTDIPSSSGSYQVLVTDMNGCIDSSNVPVTVWDLAVSIVSSDDTVCQGEEVTLTALVSGGSGTYTYYWNATSGNATYQVVPTGNPDYTLNVTDADGCTGDASLTIDIAPMPAAGFTYISSCFQNCWFNGTTTGGTAPYTYQWDFNADSIADDSQPSLGYTFADSLDHFVTLTVTDQQGCQDDTTILVDVKGGSLELHMPNVMSISSMVGNDVLDFEIFAPGYNICVDYTLTIYNRWGIKVFETSNNTNAPDLNCLSCFRCRSMEDNVLVPGTYFYVIRGTYDVLENGTITLFE